MKLPEPTREPLLNIQEIIKLKGDPEKGKVVATACLNCHRIGKEGVDYGPEITNFARSQPAEVVLKAIIEPSAEIAHGYEGVKLITKNGKEVNGRILSEKKSLHYCFPRG